MRRKFSNKLVVEHQQVTLALFSFFFLFFLFLVVFFFFFFFLLLLLLQLSGSDNLVCAMVGLPARGKTYIARKLSQRLWTHVVVTGRWHRRCGCPLLLLSMYGIYTYIWLIFMVNVGKYTIHGLFGLYEEYSGRDFSHDRHEQWKKPRLVR